MLNLQLFLPSATMKETEAEEQPPILHTWPNLYRLITGFFIFQVLLYYVITRWLA